MDTDGHGHVGPTQLKWLDAQLTAAAERSEQVIVVVHQLLVPPTDASGTVHPWFVPQYDLVDNAHEVLSILHRHAPRVRLCLHGHVHAHSLTYRHGVPFVTTSAISEYPMAWREVSVRSGCELELTAHELELPHIRSVSAKRDTRGVNDAKRGGPAEHRVLVHGRGAGCGRGAEAARRAQQQSTFSRHG